MKTLIAILFFTLLGTIAQAAPTSDPLKFADDHCYFADDTDACRLAIKADRNTQVMNHYSLTLYVCSEKNVKFGAKRSTCFAEASREMNDSDFRQKITDCANDKGFWSGMKNEKWADVAKCQSDLFAKQAGRNGGSSSSVTYGQGDGTRN
ncbi:hypothetical protein BH10BDE1_BH10BDE1_12610 [soil metagenome]